MKPDIRPLIIQGVFRDALKQMDKLQTQQEKLSVISNIVPELEKAGFTPGTMTDKLSLDLAMDGMNDTLIQADSPEQALQIIEHTMFHLWQSARIKEILN